MQPDDMRPDETHERPKLTCGCGFVACQGSAEANLAAYRVHDCRACMSDIPTRWHESVFSVWGALIAAALISIAWAVFAT